MRPRPTDPLLSFFAFPTRAAPTDRPAARSAAKEILGSGRSDRPTRPAVARAPARLGPTRPTDRLAPRLSGRNPAKVRRLHENFHVQCEQPVCGSLKLWLGGRPALIMHGQRRNLDVAVSFVICGLAPWRSLSPLFSPQCTRSRCAPCLGCHWWKLCNR